ncbi:nucleotidyl transferase AbiEii/AbiGii toxin family protein [Nesterenkonia sandarakina]|uniref:Nucleotidyltransferase AbiEii toxin of type IV toxin-antitoxin system n=1 Tax=Nesterenkonia sandarakina TaxID=272918 RepID=A0A7Z0EAW7_9MICC|nr:nucleotidyl transferase AbiEii/AbiGii toxin family protein [Nesterenkonia sandarakina]NYJ18106.1 hypothetical protein [Nesterenkonia sandarakina]
MTSRDTYSSWKALASALKEAAKKDSTASVDAHMRFAVSDRFLSRVFASSEDNEWTLKGGTGLLARVPNSRATKDVDLVTTEKELEEAQAALIEVSHRDLGDHVEFNFKSSHPTGGGNNQPNVQARQVVFTCIDIDTGKRIDDVKVDLAVEQAPTGEVEVRHPSNRLLLAKDVPSSPYRLFPVADQIADKVWATVQTYGHGRSTREKDLVDLVVLSRTQTVDLLQLRQALEAERLLRGEDRIKTFSVPDTWGPRFSVLARATELCSGLTTVHAATDHVRRLIDPAIAAAEPRTNMTWSPETGWGPASTVN